jgi:hypothetical protein
MNKTLNYPLVFSIALAISGCAGMGQKGRIGNDDGSDSCYRYLRRIDDTAVYYKDERMKTIGAGVLLTGLASAGVAALAGGNKTAIIASGIGGAVLGGFAADAYWRNKMAQAQQNKARAIDIMTGDMRMEVAKLTQVDQDISELSKCRIRQRDEIRRKYREHAISADEAQDQWKKWSEQTRKDAAEMGYLSEALNSIQRIDQSYQYAANEVDVPDPTVDKQTLQDWKRQVAEDKKIKLSEANQDTREERHEIAQQKLPQREKNKLLSEQKKKHNEKLAQLNAEFKQKEQMVQKKVNPKASEVKHLVSSVHEKFESIKKGKEDVEHLAQEGADKKGYEKVSAIPSQPTARGLAFAPNPVKEENLSCGMGRQAATTRYPAASASTVPET